MPGRQDDYAGVQAASADGPDAAAADERQRRCTRLHGAVHGAYL